MCFFAEYASNRRNVKMGFQIENGVLTKYTEENGVFDVVIPDGVTAIGSCAFVNCRNVESITIPFGVKTIGAGAFYLCSGLKSVTISESVTEIGNGAFLSCSELESVIIPDSVRTIGDNVFLRCYNLRSCKMEDSITDIGDAMFMDCKKLRSVTLPNGLTKIKEGMFYGCKELDKLEIPEGVTAIGNAAFFDCTNLKKIIIPDSVTELGDKCFMFCRNLKEVRLPSGIKKIPEGSFACCVNIKNVICASDIENKNQSDIFFVSDHEDETREIENCSVVMPDGIESIGDIAFFGCTNLKTIHLPESVREAGNLSFYQSGALEQIVIDSNAEILRGLFEDDNIIGIMKFFGNTSIVDQILGNYMQAGMDIKTYLSLKEKEAASHNNSNHFKQLRYIVVSGQRLKISRRFLNTEGYFIKRKLFNYIADIERSKESGEVSDLKNNYNDMVNIFLSAGLTDYVLYLLGKTEYLNHENMNMFIDHAMEDQPELAENLMEINQRLFGNSSLNDLLDLKI